jgi:mannose-6-phosphate isomerase-like protein (cupin superfamily)
MSYTIKNLRDVPDMAKKFGHSDSQEAHFAHKEMGAETVGFSFQVVKPGKRQAFAHRHQEAEEIYVVVAGSGRVKLDDEAKEIRALDAIRVAPGVVRTFEAGDEGLELIAFGPRHEGEVEIITEDVWGDA